MLIRNREAVVDITDLVQASHLQIARWQARLGELRRPAGPAAGPAAGRGAGPGLAATWATLAALIDMHMRAEEEICGPAVDRAAPHGAALSREIRDAHADIREMIAETDLQRPGSPRWQDLAATALAAWTRHCDDEEHGPAAAWLRGAERALRRLLGRQWRAFQEACIRDLYPDVPPTVATCELRLARPATPRLADPWYAALSCTCQACNARLSRMS